MEHLNKTDFKAQLADTADAVVLDVRTPGEWAEGVMPNAQMLNIMDQQGFMDGVDKMDPEKAYFVYCRSGARSANACAYLAGQGFNRVYNLLGGMMEWDGEVVTPTMQH